MNRFRLYCCFLALLLQSCSKGHTKPNNPDPPVVTTNLTAAASPVVIPILKGADQNGILKIAVSVTAGKSSLKDISVSVNSDAISDLNKVDLYSAASDFTNPTFIGSAPVSGSTFKIPANLNTPVGKYYIWLSPILKPTASGKNKIEIHATSLSINDSTNFSITEQTSDSYSRYQGVAVRMPGNDGVNTYRIPGLTTTDKGTLIAVYDIRYNSSADLPANIDVGMSRSTDEGATWSPMKVIMHMPLTDGVTTSGIGDPSVLFDPVSKQILVAALWSKGNRSIAGSLGNLSPDSTGQYVLTKSNDDGNTWSSLINITSQIKDPAWKIFFQGPGAGIAMQNGTLVFPSQYWQMDGTMFSTLIYSNDNGNSWKRATGAPQARTSESQVVEITPGTLMLNMRDESRSKIRGVATTQNMGTNWSALPANADKLQEPVCQASLLKANVSVTGTMKDVLFFSNPNDQSARKMTTIKASTDYGITWPTKNQLLIDERTGYGYSCLTQINGQTLGILYEGVGSLYFVRVPVKDVLATP